MSRGVLSGPSIRSKICRGSGAQTRKCVEPSGWISAPAGYRLRTSLIVEWTPPCSRSSWIGVSRRSAEIMPNQEIPSPKSQIPNSKKDFERHIWDLLGIWSLGFWDLGFPHAPQTDDRVRRHPIQRLAD